MLPQLQTAFPREVLRTDNIKAFISKFLENKSGRPFKDDHFMYVPK